MKPFTALGVRSPTEARVFQVIAALGAIITIIYWFVSYEAAGSVLLAGFSMAAGILGLMLAGAGRDWKTLPGNPRDPERPLLDESGRIPSPTLAPFAVGVGASVCLLSLVFGPAPLIVGILPLAWGAIDWLRRAGAELDAQKRSAATGAQRPRRDRVIR